MQGGEASTSFTLPERLPPGASKRYSTTTFLGFWVHRHMKWVKYSQQAMRKDGHPMTVAVVS